MGIENFNPSVWSAKLFVRLRKALVFASLVNNDYEGEITGMGDSVRINEIGSITISDYTKYNSISWQKLTGAQKILTIDQARTFSFVIDDIDTAQQNPKVMNAAMDEAAYAVADEIDKYIAGLWTDAGITNATNLGTPSAAKSVSAGNVIQTITYMGRYMSENNVPEGNRYLVVKPWVHQKLLLAEVGGIGASAVPKVFDDGALTSGYVGDALGFRVILSNNLVNDANGATAVMAFNRSAISYAGQISKIQAVNREDYFDAGVKGLYVFGAKVVRPEALCVAHLAEASD